MITIATSLLVTSFAILLIVFFRKKINLISNYTVYVFFTVLYSVFPTLTFLKIEPQIWFRHYTLNESELLVSTQILIMSLCNIIFAYVFYSSYRKSNISAVRPQAAKKDIYQNLIFISYTIACLALILIGLKYSYTSNRGIIVHSIISNAKTILASVYVFFIVRYGLSYRILLMFFGYVFLLLVEQSRIYFVMVLVTSLLYLQNTKEVKKETLISTNGLLQVISSVKTGKLSNRQMIALLLVSFVLLSYVALARSGVKIEDFIIFLNPFYIEGDYGSYMILQTYDLVYKGVIDFYTLFLDYLVDPIIYLLPRFIFMLSGINKDGVGIFETFVASYDRYLAEKYAPVGGFHYIAQASSALPFLGPLLVTYIFARVTVRVENSMRKATVSNFSELTYYLYSSGFAFVFIKTLFHQTVKYYATLAIPAYFLFFLLKRYDKEKAKRSHQKNLHFQRSLSN